MDPELLGVPVEVGVDVFPVSIPGSQDVGQRGELVVPHGHGVQRGPVQGVDESQEPGPLATAGAGEGREHRGTHEHLAVGSV